MSWADTAALKARIETVGNLAAKTFVTEAKYPPPNSTTKVDPPFVVIHPADGVNESESATGPRVVTHPEFTIHVVGASANSAGVVLDLLKTNLFPNGKGIRLTVTGRRNDPLWFESPVPAQLDTSVTPPLTYHVVRCGWRSQPA